MFVVFAIIIINNFDNSLVVCHLIRLTSMAITIVSRSYVPVLVR